jgi:carbon-monoxide dehydrogenase small subunit
MAEHELSLTVNGIPTTRRVPDSRLLREFVREDLGLIGTKIGCEDGMCGACSLLVDGEVVKSCLILAAEVRDCEITTIEGMARSTAELHPVQQAMIDNFGFQCGFCTPGFIMTMAALLNDTTAAVEYDQDSAREALVGNICRCTGYTSIVNSFLDAQARMAGPDTSAIDDDGSPIPAADKREG